VAAPSSVWQWFSLCPIKSNGNENFKVIQNLGFFPDHPQNWITGSFCHSRHFQKISERSVYNFLSYLADTQTNKQTNKIWQKHNLLGGGNHISMQMCFIFLLLFIFNSFTKELHGRNGRSGTAVFRENIVAICTHDRRLWIWIYPWISTENLWIWIWMANFISTASLAFTCVGLRFMVKVFND